MSDNQDFRSRLKRILDEEATDDQIRTMVKEAMGAERPEDVEITCKECAATRKYRVMVRNPKVAAETLEKLINQANGTPARADQPDTTTDAYLDITQATDEDLARYLKTADSVSLS